MPRPAHTLHVSPSQIATFRDCPRKWGFKYIEGREAPENRYAQLGKDIHAVLEAWFKLGKHPDLNTKEGQIACVGLKHYPPPSPELRAEHEMHFEFDGVEYYGLIDLHYAASREELVVNDHKSTTNFKWAKSESDLEADPQRVLYSAWGTIKYGVRRVRAKWVYYRTTPPPASMTVEITQTVDQIWDAMGPVHDDAKKIVRSRRLKLLDLEQNFNTCEAYGGCPFKEPCLGGQRVSARDRMKASLAQAARAEKAREQGHAPSLHRRTQPPPSLILIRGGNQNENENAKENKNVSLLADLQAMNGEPEPKPEPKAEPKSNVEPGPGSGSSLLSGMNDEPESIIPPVSETYDPPPDNSSSDEGSTPPPATRRTRGANKAKTGEGVDESMARLQMHCHAIAAGQPVALVEEHFRSWKASLSG